MPIPKSIFISPPELQGCNMIEAANTTHPMFEQLISIVPETDDTTEHCYHTQGVHIKMNNGAPTGEVHIELNCQKCLGKVLMAHQVELHQVKLNLPDACPIKALGQTVVYVENYPHDVE